MITLRPANEVDARELALALREADRAEVLSLGREPEEALLVSLEHSAEAWTARTEAGAIVCMAGVCPSSLIGPTAYPWLLGSRLVSANPVTFVRESRRLVERWNARWSTLMNFVDDRYEAAHRWLMRLGFTLSEARPTPPTGALFRLAERNRHG